MEMSVMSVRSEALLLTYISVHSESLFFYCWTLFSLKMLELSLLEVAPGSSFSDYIVAPT